MSTSRHTISPHGSAKATEGLIFPSQANLSIYNQLRQLGRAGLSIRNRLCSIQSDAEFVDRVQSDLNLPLIANERSGSWYVKPELKVESVYFKSTDGHFGQWSFSLRRLNLQLLDILGNYGGCIIVDSTRRGKYVPDALSKTIPIWCAVINRLLFPESKRRHAVEQLARVVPETEISIIEARIQMFVDQIKTFGLDLLSIRRKLKKPIKIYWVARTIGLDAKNVTLAEGDASDFHSMFLCMASDLPSSVSHGAGFEYVQGAADDSEAWAHGLTPEIFWGHSKVIMGTPETELADVVSSIAGTYSNLSMKPRCCQILRDSGIFVGTEKNRSDAEFLGGLIINCSPDSVLGKDTSADPSFLQLQCGPGKQGSRDLRQELTKIAAFLDKSQAKKILVCCTSGKDLSIGVALVILVLYTDDQGLLVEPLQKVARQVDKALIKKRLSWIMFSVPSARPSRATLNSVNSFLIAQPG